MKSRRTLIGAALALAASALALTLYAAHAAHAARSATKHILVVTVTKGFRHDSIPVAEQTIQMLGNNTGAWQTDFVRNDDEMREKMTPDALKKYDAVVFANTTGELPLPDYQGFLDYIQAGHGFVAMHSGSDTFHKWPPTPDAPVSAYVQMLGAEFETHHHQTAVDAHILDPNHPSTKPLVAAGKRANGASPGDLQQHTFATGKTWQVYDEIYLFKNVDRPHLHVLLALDRHPNDGSPEAGQPGEYLVSWCKSYGNGRVFYTSLGHRQEMWRDPLYQQHILGGIKFALGLAKGSTAPNPPLHAAR
ncbi:MAG TPA: ThuA domain-containing protein [Chthonomonadaceae bacterium]|nr:ThuA domain-containing protein [Chthonomonadaceae bacterium]